MDWPGPHVIDRNAIYFYLLFSHPCLTSLFIRSIRHSEELREIEEIRVPREGE